jgi:hypothetical protein
MCGRNEQKLLFADTHQQSHGQSAGRQSSSTRSCNCGCYSPPSRSLAAGEILSPCRLRLLDEPSFHTSLGSNCKPTMPLMPPSLSLLTLPQLLVAPLLLPLLLLLLLLPLFLAGRKEETVVSRGGAADATQQCSWGSTAVASRVSSRP